MDIIAESIEPIELEQIDATVKLPDIEELPPKAKAKAKAKPRAKAVRAEPEPLPVEEVPVIAAPKAKARKPAAALKPAPAAAPVPAPAAPGISDVLGMLATALLDQRQQRNAQRSAMYQAFLD
jgi:hypothetical protein